MIFKQLKIWWEDGKLWFILGLIVLFLIVASIVGMAFLDSYARVYFLAMLPGQILQMLLWSVLGAYFFVIILYRYGIPLAGGRNSRVESDDVKVTFKDVIGLTEAKREAMEVVSLIKDRAKVRKIGGKVVRGILMMGPPGCGKTYLAKAIAHEAGVPFFSIAGSEFVEVFVGVGAGRVRKLFKKARRAAMLQGAAIIFIDELEVVGQQRQFSFMGGQETNSTLNQLLVNMDGLEKDEEGHVIVIGATNASQCVLDPALLRPGRFDRHIAISRPHLKDREEMFRYYLKKIKMTADVDAGRLARKSVGRTPADIENLVKEAALISVRKQKDRLTMEEISEAFERIDLGSETHLELTPLEQERIAFHEAGHLVVLYLQHPTDDVFKASIKTRGGALGVVYHHPREELYTQTRDELYADIKVSVAGYIAEKVKYGVTSTGACSDFQNATGMASSMVWNYGMGTNGFVGDYSVLLHRGINYESRISEAMKDSLNKETQGIMHQAAEEVQAFLKQEWNLMEIFAKALIEKKELDFDEIEAIFKEHGKQRVWPVA